MKIGIFDSGIGGLNILSKMLVYYPKNSYIYYADNLNMPYGNKSICTIKGAIIKSMDYFRSINVDIVIIACNTASTLLGEYVIKNYPFKVYLVTPNLNKALGCKKFTLLATDNTVNYFRANIDNIAKLNNITSKELNSKMNIVPSSLLAYLTEYNAPNFFVNYRYVRDILKNVKKEYPIILGCTHYTYYKQYIASLGYECISEIDFFNNFDIQKYIKPTDFDNLTFMFTGKRNSKKYLEIINNLL